MNEGSTKSIILIIEEDKKTRRKSYKKGEHYVGRSGTCNPPKPCVNYHSSRDNYVRSTTYFRVNIVALSAGDNDLYLLLLFVF